MQKDTNICEIKTQISNDNQREELYILLKEFLNEYEEKNNNLPVEIKKENIFQKLISKFKSYFKTSPSYEEQKKISNEKYKEYKKILDNILDEKKDDSKLFFILKNENLIGFEMAQISKEENNKIVGWKPWMYIQKPYRGTIQTFINENNEFENKQIALHLDNTVEKWFKDNNVNFQKTSTGINMQSNILTYIRQGFNPIDKDNKTVFLEKDMENPLSKEEIKELFKAVKQGKICEPTTNFKQLLQSNISLEEQRKNSDNFVLKQDAKTTKNDIEKEI